MQFNSKKIKLGKWILRKFPDNETYIRVLENVENKNVYILCSLDNADSKIMPIILLSKTLKKLGALNVKLISPYLGYMRQDKVFKKGESLSSEIFANLLSNYVDKVITVMPHLHRYKSLEEIYNIPTKIINIFEELALSIKNNIKNPFIIGPDAESDWIANVAKKINAPYKIMQKKRYGDREVKIEFEKLKNLNYSYVLLDDVISSGNTMCEAIKFLPTKPIIISIHGIFSENAYNNLLNSGAKKIITSNTIIHKTNAIDISNHILNYLLNNNLF